MIFCLLLSLLLCVTAIASADLGWPLQQNYGVSATFGESRGNHYHAGVDLSTNGKTGLPVLAVADGSIYRMKIQKRAYGKALYIQHANGTQSVYAHLEGYSAELGLQKLYTDRVLRTGSPYVGDVFVDPPIRVKQGQVVAYSGESGAGLPHLHLEIRKNETSIINPLTNGLKDALDPIAPTFQAVYFYPLTKDSAINGDLETTEFRLKKNQSAFVTDSMPVVRGDFAVSVSVYDSALRPYHRTPYRLIYSIDEKELYSIELDQFSYTAPDGFGLFYDLGKPGPAFYEYPILLSRRANFSLPFVKRSVPFSTSALAPGTHRLKIHAMDANNNVSIADVPFVVNHPPSLDIESIQSDPADIIVRATIRDPNWTGAGLLKGEMEYSIDAGKSFSRVLSTSLIPGQNQSLGFLYRIPLSQLGNSRSVLMRGRAFDGVEYSSYAFANFHPGETALLERRASLPSGNLRYETYGGMIRIIFDSDEALTGKIEASIGDPPKLLPLQFLSLNSAAGQIAAPKQDGDFVISLPGGESLSVPVRFVNAGRPAVVANENARISFHENSLYEDSWIWTKALPQYTSRSLPVIGPILQVGPRGLSLKKDASLSFSYPDSVKSPEKLSIYRWNRVSQSWSSLPSNVNRSGRTVETKIDYLDLYALIYDNVAPRISNLFPKARSTTRNQTPVLAVQIRDSGMDVDDEKITFYVDGTEYSPEYDPDRNIATAKVNQVLRKGSHSFYAVAYDYAGNKTQSRTVTFRVK